MSMMPYLKLPPSIITHRDPMDSTVLAALHRLFGGSALMRDG